MKDESSLRRQLDPGESLLWVGAPRQGVVTREYDVILVPVGLFFLGFAVFWEVTAITMAAPPLFVIVGCLTIVVGLYLVTGRFLIDARARISTLYGLTSHRVIIITGSRRPRTTSTRLEDLAYTELRERLDGTGTILLDRPRGTTFSSSDFHWPGLTRKTPSFELIDNARSVYEALRAAQRSRS